MTVFDSAWFAERTFDADQFPTTDLAARKRASGVTVSVVLPAHNEADTIGPMVEAAVGLGGTLVDEVVVMDGDSSDRTAEIAAQRGAVVHADRDVCPELGDTRGKGDALWRSLDVTTGDIVAFVDTDIRNAHPRFVTGLLGPLLLDPEIALVKAFYDRPIAMGDTLHASGGGRVTELMARPLLNLFWPELAGLVQPLSGEYAGRRELLEAIPFFTGYGVELGMLVDTLALRGARAIAQVDLSERIHRNQSMPALSRMAYGILQVAARRLADDDRLRLAEFDAARYQQFERRDGRIEPMPTEVRVVERPAFADYRAQRSQRTP